MPISIPETKFKPSIKTFFLSKVPSPSVSSKIRILSLPCPSGAGTGYVCPSTTQSLPRASMVKLIGFTTSGSAAARVILKPFGIVIALAASTPESPELIIGSRGGITIMSFEFNSFGKLGRLA